MRNIEERLKRCSKCGLTLPLSDFYYRHDENRYCNHCKNCVKARSHAWREAHHQEALQYGHIWRQAHRQEMAKYACSYRQTPNGRAVDVRYRAKRRAAKAIDNTLTGNEWARIIKRQKSRCYWCKTKTKAKLLEMDHVIPLSKGGHHTKENVVGACHECNSRKRAKRWSTV